MQHIHAPLALMPVTALHSSFPQVHAAHFAQGSSTVYRLETLLLDRHTSKCFSKDITEYLDCLDKYQNKCINKYKTKLIDKHKNKRMGKYKNQLHQEVNLSPIPSGAALAPLARHLHAAPTPPPRSSHTAPTQQQLALTQPSRSSHCGPTQPPRCLRTAPTPLPCWWRVADGAGWGLQSWLGGAGWAGTGQLVGTFAQPKRAYVCGVNYALQTSKERKSWRKMGEGGKHCVENTHVMEKNK